MCPCRGGRAWEGGEGRVQAERPTRTRPQGQGNGPEGERHTQLDRSPCPGRRCPCGCPQQAVRIDQPLARGVARIAAGWGSPPLWPAPLHHVHQPTRLMRDAREVGSEPYVEPPALSVLRQALTSPQGIVPCSAISARASSAASMSANLDLSSSG